MAVYRHVSTSFWTDSKISDDFDSNEKYIYLYLFTNPHTNLCGCYEISLKQMAYETSFSVDIINDVIESLECVHDVIRYDHDTKEVLIVNWHKYNWTDSEKFRKPLQREIAKIKSDNFRIYLTDVFNGVANPRMYYKYGIDTVSDDVNNAQFAMDTVCETTISDTDTDTVSVTDTVSDTETETDAGTFSETVFEITKYLNEMCGTSYKASSKKTRELIKARLNEGFTVDDFKTVIYKKAKQWMNDPKMCKFLRPETLFSNKFEGYLNEREPVSSNDVSRWDVDF